MQMGAGQSRAEDSRRGGQTRIIVDYRGLPLPLTRIHSVLYRIRPKKPFRGIHLLRTTEYRANLVSHHFANTLRVERS